MLGEIRRTGLCIVLVTEKLAEQTSQALAVNGIRHHPDIAPLTLVALLSLDQVGRRYNDNNRDIGGAIILPDLIQKCIDGCDLPLTGVIQHRFIHNQHVWWRSHHRIVSQRDVVDGAATFHIEAAKQTFNPVGQPVVPHDSHGCTDATGDNPF